MTNAVLNASPSLSSANATAHPTATALTLNNVHWSPNKNSNIQNDENPVAAAFALRDISCRIEAGNMVAIVGPNGAGKTSLLRSMLGLISISSGQIELAGEDIDSLTVQQRAQWMSYVPQQSSSEFELRVQDVVQMGRLPHSSLFGDGTSQWWQWQKRAETGRQHVLQALAAVGMQAHSHRLMNKLSGGELQRVFIARALAQQAKILVLDEPTNHLDVFYQHQILGLLKSLKLTIVLTIHDLNLAAQYCDHILLLNNGQLEAAGTPADVFTAPALTRVFRLPCAVQLTGGKSSIPSICFHAEQAFSSTQQNPA